MPGVDLNIELPTAANTMAEFRSLLVTAIEAIAADLEPRIPAGALYITTDLSMGGAALLNVGGIRLSGGESTEIGTLYMDEELHAVTAAGSVQITDNGTLAITALGTIGGDYGGANPAAVTYDNTSGEYRFTEDPGVWADLVFSTAVLEGTNGSVRLACPTTVSGAKTVNFNCFPASGIVGLAYDAATAAYVNASVERETVTHLFSGINATIVTATSDYAHTAEFTATLPVNYSAVNVNMGVSASSPHLTTSSGIYFYYSHTFGCIGLRQGDRVKSVKVRYSGNSGASVFNVDVAHFRHDTGLAYTVGTPATANQGHVTVVPGTGNNTIGTHDGMLDVMWVRISGTATGVTVNSIDVVWDHP